MGGSSAKSLLNYFMFAFFFLLYSMIPASKATPPRRRIAAHRVLFCTTSPVLTLDADFRLEPDPRLDVPLFRLEEPLPSEEEPSLLLPRELLPRVLFPSELFPRRITVVISVGITIIVVVLIKVWIIGCCCF